MKQLINGLVYDTLTATKLIKVSSGSNHTYNGFEFYKTPNGRLFKEKVWFGCSGTLGRLSETDEQELFQILVEYNISNDTIKNLCPNLKICEA
jgi:hypothetical protein